MEDEEKKRYDCSDRLANDEKVCAKADKNEADERHVVGLQTEIEVQIRRIWREDFANGVYGNKPLFNLPRTGTIGVKTSGEDLS